MSDAQAAPALRPAATIILLRPASTGPAAEVLLLQRSRKVGFFPRAWVFPGGRVDEEDHCLPFCGTVASLAPGAEHFAVAAIRECFEESGIWLGSGTPGEGLRDRLLETRKGIVSTDGVMPDLSRLRCWAWWATPVAEKRRYDTRFFVARVTRADSLHASHDTRETVASQWLTPHHALAAAEAGELFMAPPTWRTLQELAEFADLDTIWEHAATRPIPRVMPVIEHTEHGVAIRLPGHPAHGEPVHPLHARFARSIEWRDGRWNDG